MFQSDFFFFSQILPLKQYTEHCFGHCVIGKGFFLHLNSQPPHVVVILLLDSEFNTQKMHFDKRLQSTSTVRHPVQPPDSVP